MTIRQINSNDLLEVESLANLVYPDCYYENFESFCSKINGYPKGCFVAEFDNKICGYIISFPFLIDQVFPLNTNFYSIADPNCFYIHDLCVSKDFHGKGVGKRLFETVAKNKETLSLVAVLNSENFWSKLGFEVVKKILYNDIPASHMIKKGS